MKKSLIALAIFMFSIPTAIADIPDMDPTDPANWFEYNGSSSTHTFSIRFPQDWKAKQYGDNLQGFSHAEEDGESYFAIQEFEGQSYDQVIQYFTNESTELVEVIDIIFPGTSGLVAKEAMYLIPDTGKKLTKTLIKRGSLIVVLSSKDFEDIQNTALGENYGEIVELMYESFEFSDDWHQYIDLENKYTFIFPANLNLNNLSNGVTISDSKLSDEIVFDIFYYDQTDIEDAPEEAEGSDESLRETQATLFHGMQNAIRATYYNSETKKEFNRIFVEKNGTSYGISDINIETNFPRMDYYNQYVVEMVESFEFFDIEEKTRVFKYFPDIKDDHPNKLAIHYLKEHGVIDGYEDGTFKPDGEINRAELTKMIVAAKLDPNEDEYKDCFPDVTDEWFAPYICYAKEQKWVNGYEDGNFKPEKNINRVEALKIILEVLYESIEEESLEDESVADVDTEAWYGKYFIFADNNNLLDKQHITREGDIYNFYPGRNITRKEVSETIYKSLMDVSIGFL